MFGFGGSELLIVLAIGTLLFGGSQIPKLCRGVGQGIRELRGAVKEAQEIPDLLEHDK